MSAWMMGAMVLLDRTLIPYHTQTIPGDHGSISAQGYSWSIPVSLCHSFPVTYLLSYLIFLPQSLWKKKCFDLNDFVLKQFGQSAICFSKVFFTDLILLSLLSCSLYHEILLSFNFIKCKAIHVMSSTSFWRLPDNLIEILMCDYLAAPKIGWSGCHQCSYGMKRHIVWGWGWPFKVKTKRNFGHGICMMWMIMWSSYTSYHTMGLSWLNGCDGKCSNIM